MGSVHAWRFTQRIAGMILGGLGLILTVVMGVLSLGFASMEIEAMGYGEENIRLPLTPMEPENRAKLFAEMRKQGVNV